jgi:prefoldin subunit 5
METQGESMGALSESLQRLEARLEAVASTLAAIEERDGDIHRIVATVDNGREAELEKKLEAAEQQIAELRAQIEATPQAPAAAARKTIPASTAQFLSKQGIALENVEAGALDSALTGLSLEQRIAVKAQLLRAGVVS